MSTAIDKGYDFSGARPSTATLDKAGAKFVVRYEAPDNGSTSWKLLTQSEASAYRAAGINLVSNFEWYSTRATEGFNAGVADAKTAKAEHAACGGPADAPIIFSVDESVAGSKVKAYFQGVASVLGVNRTGAYGSYSVVTYLISQGLIGKTRDGSGHYFAWQTYAWSDGAYQEKCCLSQDKNGQKLSDGSDVDLDHSHSADYGQWDYKGSEEDVALSDADVEKVAERVWRSTRMPKKSGDDVKYWPQSFMQWINDGVDAQADTLTAIQAAVAKLQTPDVDENTLAAAIVAQPEFFKNLASALADHVKVA